jgi:HSP20 family protein
MRLIKWRSPNIFDPVSDFWGLRSEASWSPAVDVFENKENLVMKVDLPGMKQSEIDVYVEDGVLAIKGEKKKETEAKEKNFYCMERVCGSFERRFTLPTNVDASKVKATYKDGVLELALPKKEEAQPKQIKVNVN